MLPVLFLKSKSPNSVVPVVNRASVLIVTHPLLLSSTASAVGNAVSRRLQAANGLGGGIETRGTTTIMSSRFDNCTASLSGGGAYVGSGSATFRGVTFRDNNAFEGAGIFVQEGSLVVQDSVFEGNVATNTASDPDLFVRAGVSVEACGNTADSDSLNVCSGAATLWAATSTVVAVGLAMTLFA